MRQSQTLCLKQNGRKKLKSTFITIGVLFSGLSQASSVTGEIEKLIIGRQGHQVFVHIKGAPQTCGKDHSLGFNYAFSLKDHGAGKEILSAMLAVQVSGRRITIQGESQRA